MTLHNGYKSHGPWRLKHNKVQPTEPTPWIKGLWEADIRSDGQEIPRQMLYLASCCGVSRNVYYIRHTHNKAFYYFCDNN
jgi:hypothetical protein